ncbi:hypothetical protein [Amycolatopsis sp. 195334CR]|uniref:hypothetical protein n=1 Tax=Amycolatopsis sp. 195334CR TaxID=2814588 RepID=UPI001A8F9506|nr:hypothetical protein [Amycolatopsis sp. 195334CR]MBN6033654.1 hypothetical protein [Amycolatopsis sp. 195334CR]
MVRIALLVAGGLLVLGGLVSLALPVSAQLGRVDVDCGSTFAPGSEELDTFVGADEFNDAVGGDTPRLRAAPVCALAVEDRRWVGWPVTGVGVLVLLSGVFWGRRPVSPD